jgi:hypothetical protein
MFNFGRQDSPPKVRVVPYIPMLKEDNVRKGFIEDAGFSQLAAQATELWLRVFLEVAFTYGWRKGELLALRVPLRAGRSGSTWVRRRTARGGK